MLTYTPGGQPMTPETWREAAAEGADVVTPTWEIGAARYRPRQHYWIEGGSLTTPSRAEPLPESYAVEVPDREGWRRDGGMAPTGTRLEEVPAADLGAYRRASWLPR